MKQNSWIRLVLVTVITLVAVFSLHSCNGKEQGSVNAPEQISVRFPIPIIEAGQTPFYVAQDKSYYADENLDVKFEMGSRELNPVKTVATGQDTFGVLGGPDTLLTAISKGQPLKAIAILHRNSNFPALVTLKSSEITKLEQLQGKKLAFYTVIFLQMYFGISYEKIRFNIRRLM